MYSRTSRWIMNDDSSEFQSSAADDLFPVRHQQTSYKRSHVRFLILSISQLLPCLLACISHIACAHHRQPSDIDAPLLHSFIGPIIWWACFETSACGLSFLLSKSKKRFKCFLVSAKSESDGQLCPFGGKRQRAATAACRTTSAIKLALAIFFFKQERD